MDGFDDDGFSDILLTDFFVEEVSLTQLDDLPTQNLINVGVTDDTRYNDVNVTTPQNIQQRNRDRIPCKTRKQNDWAISCYGDWVVWRNSKMETLLDERSPVPPSLETQTLDTMNYWLTRFIVECQRRDGKPYPPNTLYQIASSIQRYLREECDRTDVQILEKKDPHFDGFRKVLDHRMKELTNEGVGVHRNRADPVEINEEDVLWERGVIGFEPAKSLSYGVFYYNCKIFGFRGGDEHRNLDVDQYQITEVEGKKVLIFQGRTSKNVQGGLLQRRVEPKFIKQFASPENPRCVVKLFEKYLQSIPSKGPFYRKPLVSKNGQPVVFSMQVIGVNTIAKYMKSMFEEAGIDTTGKNIRNHSGKVTLCTTLYKENYEEQTIMKRSGHRSAAVRDYKRPSNKLQMQVSNALQPPMPKKLKCETFVSTETSKVSDLSPKTELLSIPELPKPDESLQNRPLKIINSYDNAGINGNVNPNPTPSEYSVDTIRLSVPENITTVIIDKNGKKVTISL